MRGLTNYITESNWDDILLVWFVLVDEAYQALGPHQRQRRTGPPPRFSDSEVITVSLFCDTFFHGCEALALSLLRQKYQALFPHLLSDSRFNRRRRCLLPQLEAIRRQLTTELIQPEDRLRLVDSAPIPVCTYQRHPRCTTVVGHDYYSVMPSRRAKLFGVRLDLTVTADQVIDQWMISPSAPRDSKQMEALCEDASGLCVLGDNAFHDPTVNTRLRRLRDVTVWAVPRKSQEHLQWPAAFRRIVNRIRRRVETVLSVLCTVFHLEQPGSRSWSGLIVRSATRILAYTISFCTGSILRSFRTSN